MNFHVRIVIAAAAMLAVVVPSSQAADQSSPEGLVAVRSWDLEQLYLRPNTDLASYRKVMIDPVQITFRKDFNRSEQDSKGLSRRLSADDVRTLAEDMTATLQNSVSEAFKARGYEIVATPGPGVLRLTPTAADLYINAADVRPAAPGQTRFATKDAGEATLTLEVRDSVSSAVLARVVDHRIARQTKGTQISDLRIANNVSNGFWLDEIFRRWASACAKELGTARIS